MNRTLPHISIWIEKRLYSFGRFLMFSASLFILGFMILHFYELTIEVMEAGSGEFEEFSLWYRTLIYLLTAYIVYLSGLLFLLLIFYAENTRQAGITTRRGHWILKRLIFVPITLISFVLLVEAGGLVYQPTSYWFGALEPISNQIEGILARVFVVGVLVVGFIKAFSD